MASKKRTTVTIETRQRTVIRRRRGQTVAWRKQCRDAPDTDDGGYQFWLAKLNQFRRVDGKYEFIGVNSNDEG